MYRCFSIGTNFQKPFTVTKLMEQKFTVSNKKYMEKYNEKKGVF